MATPPGKLSGSDLSRVGRDGAILTACVTVGGYILSKIDPEMGDPTKYAIVVLLYMGGKALWKFFTDTRPNKDDSDEVANPGPDPPADPPA